MDEAVTSGEWRLRPAILGLLGAAAGIAAHAILGEHHDISALQAAMLAFVTVAPGLIGFTLERRRWLWSLGFSIAWGLVAAGLVYWSGAPGGWDSAGGWRVFSLFLAIAIAAPLFQAARDVGAMRFAYASVHDHGWTNILLWGASWAFVGVTFLLAALLGELFHLIRIDFLRDLMRENWFWRVLGGGAFGAGLGLLRERDALVRLLRTVATTVLAVLAPVLAAGLVFFVLALPFTGLDALWEATRSTTPILLGCIVGALILANVVIGNGPAEEAGSRALRWAAMALAATMLPLAGIAATATGLRIGQHGFTPDRLWALTFVSIAIAFGLAYLAALVRGRLGWAAKVRPANLALLFGLCAVALLLATPLISFNAISARDQVARLEAGKVSADRFDWGALAFDFGAPGKAALERLKRSKNPAIRQAALNAHRDLGRLKMLPSPDGYDRAEVSKRLRILPEARALPDDLLDLLAQPSECGAREEGCTLIFLGSGEEALVLKDRCYAPGGRVTCHDIGQVRRINGKWRDATFAPDPAGDDAAAERRLMLEQAYKAGTFEVRTVPRRQLFIGGQPVGDPFE